MYIYIILSCAEFWQLVFLNCAGGVTSGCVCALLEHEILLIQPAYLSLPDAWAFLGA